MQREAKVGLLVVSALVVLGVAVFLISENRSLFVRKNRYSIEFATVNGLSLGSPVQIDGVTVGSIERVVLPERVEEAYITVWVTVDRRFADRIREDSLAWIKTLGLLGDKYIDISSGSAGANRVEAEGRIPASPPTDVDRLLATGGNAVENFVAISYSLRNILERMDEGKGLLGELTSETDSGKKAKQDVLAFLESARRIMETIETGDGTLARLINDDTLVRKLEGSAERLDNVLAEIQQGDGVIATLLNDPDLSDRLRQTLTGMSQAADDINALTTALRSGDGLLGTLISDEEFSRQLSSDLKQLLHNLNMVSAKIANADGTLGMLIADPRVYEAINDVIVGVDESKTLRWLVRKSQKKGIEVRYEAEQERLSTEEASKN
jgi:phospholipid/cholesterol/gamma-HCH transport system substrate-binding protein